MFRKLTRISPASPLALIALFVALGGVSYAAGTIGTSDLQNGAVTKKKVHRNAIVAGKIREGAVIGEKIAAGAVTGDKVAAGAVGTPKLADEAVTGAKVNESTLGIVPDAAALAGKQPLAYESKAFGGDDPGSVNLPTSATTEVKAVALPAGTYLIIGRGGVNNNGASEIGAGQVACSVGAASSSQTVSFGALGANGKVGDREEFEAMAIATLDSPGNATLRCSTNSGWELGNITNPALVAVSLQP